MGLRPEEVQGKYSYQLSGGQRQRIMLARAFMVKPRLIVADELVSMIDVSLRAGILNVMLDLKQRWGISFIYITHDLSTAHYISNEVAVMYLKIIVEAGSMDKIVNEPLHPYVQLLTDSIPILDLEHGRREIKLLRIELSRRAELMKGCKFYDRCPRRMYALKRVQRSLRSIESIE
ncbi:MAG: hypothetical protein DRJ59_01290 [Thermoprotei archaeon]|nr:MAG: hypothetical protein DRJ59_01290 [Thermoprotei archaeon]